MTKNVFRFGAAILSVMLTACISEKCDKECEYPTSAFTEIATLGATLTKRGLPLPDTVDETFYGGEEPFVTARIDLYFSPHPDRETIAFDVIDGYVSLIADTTQYEYTFSQQAYDQFQVIEPNSMVFDPPGPANQYSSAVRLESYNEELIVNGNHLIVTTLGNWFAAPARATHVELWFRETPASVRELVRRIPLKSFDFWTRYLEPLIELNGTD